MWSGHNVRTINFCLVEDLPTLIWVANLASLELHTALHRAVGSKGTPDETWTPDMVVFDLDPGEPAAFAECAQVGLWLRESLDGLGLASLPEDVGQQGPAGLRARSTRRATYDQTKSFARAMAQIGERAHPKLVVSNMAKELRQGQGAHRLEPERRAQDDRVGVLAAGPAPADGVGPPPLVRGRGRRRRRARAPASRPPRPSGASRPTATSSPPWWSWNNGCRRLVDRSGWKGVPVADRAG